MPLPNLIEIVPLERPVHAGITVPGSKSITNRALILAALGKGETRIKSALWSEDTQIMVEALKELGFKIKVTQDPNEFCNRTIAVKGLGGIVPKGGTPNKPLELFVGNAGTAARFLTAFVCLGSGVYKLTGVQRMHSRPQAALFDALRKPTIHERLLGLISPHLSKLGYKIESTDGKLPVTIYGGGSRPGKCRVSIVESSQFASALMLCAKIGGWTVECVGQENADELPYVEMTERMVESFPSHGGESFKVEPDSSSGSYFLAANWLLQNDANSPTASSNIRVPNWPKSTWQIDTRFPDFLETTLPRTISRLNELGDSIMTAIVLAPFNNSNSQFNQSVVFTHLGRLRLQECDRVAALHKELEKCGARVEEDIVNETLTVYPSELHGAEIETYNDHRMAMCFAVLGLKVPGIKIINPACVKKTFPNFFQKFCMPPPHGFGATILDGNTGRKLAMDELFAD